MKIVRRRFQECNWIFRDLKGIQLKPDETRRNILSHAISYKRPTNPDRVDTTDKLKHSVSNPRKSLDQDEIEAKVRTEFKICLESSSTYLKHIRTTAPRQLY